MHITNVQYILDRFCCFISDSPKLLHVPLIPPGNFTPMFYQLLCASFCAREEIVWISEWSSQLYTQLKQLRKESLKKIQAWTGFEPMTSAIPVQCSTNWAIKPTGSWSLCEFVIYPLRRWDESENSYIWTAEGRINKWMIIAGNCSHDHRFLLQMKHKATDFKRWSNVSWINWRPYKNSLVNLS